MHSDEDESRRPRAAGEREERWVTQGHAGNSITDGYGRARRC